MTRTDRFFDTNVLLYAFSEDGGKASVAEREIATGGFVSVQILVEFVSVARRKLKHDWPAIRQALSAISIRLRCTEAGLAEHRLALEIAEQTNFSFFDAFHIACAESAGCTQLVSEDMNHGQRIGSVTVHNPFL